MSASPISKKIVLSSTLKEKTNASTDKLFLLSCKKYSDNCWGFIVCENIGGYYMVSISVLMSKCYLSCICPDYKFRETACKHQVSYKGYCSHFF